MNTHLSAHFPTIQVVAFAIGAVVMKITNKDTPWYEIGKAVLWGGAFSALFAASGSC